MRTRAVLVAVAVATGTLAFPAAASAHGLVGRSDLPIPDWLFTWGATLVLVVSFLALAALWPKPKLQDGGWRPAPAWLSRVVLSRPVEIICGSIGVALLVLVVYAGLAGEQTITANWAPTFVYVAFWLGLVPLSVLFGDVYRAFNPWRTIGRAVGWTFKRVSSEPPAPLPYPDKLGYWPAAAGLFAFAWLELVAISGDEPDSVAIATLIYSALTLIGMALYGTERWADRGDAFSVYFGLFARLSPWERRDDRLGLRKPLSGLADWPGGPGAVALLAVMIGTVSFDGLSAGQPFNDFIRDPLQWMADIGLAGPPAVRTVFTIILLFAVVVAGGFYWLGIRGARTVDRSRRTVDLARSFVHTLVPIALAYVAAHYVSLLLLQGQALAFLASDPLGRGSDLFGTADATIDYGFIGAEAFWYMQVGFVVAGHVAALVLAHDRALVAFSNVKAAVQSQYWLLAVMIGYTTLALWLLAQAREG